MSQITLNDFENLKVPQFAEKVVEVDDIDFLASLEAWEKDGENRKGAINAINKRQGELFEKSQKVTEEVVEDTTEEVVEDEYVGEVVEDTVEDTAEEVIQNETQETPPTVSNEIHDDPFGDAASLEKIEEEQRKKSVEDAKKMRLSLDKMAQFAKGHHAVTEEVDMSLFMAKAWLGKYLGTLSVDNPYEVGKIENESQIPPIADHYTENDLEFVKARRDFSYKNTLDAVLDLRKSLDEKIADLDELFVNSRFMQVALTQCYVKLSEAKFILGNQLSKLRK